MRIGDVVDTPRFKAITINRIHVSEDGGHYICKTGCLFRGAGT